MKSRHSVILDFTPSEINSVKILRQATHLGTSLRSYPFYFHTGSVWVAWRSCECAWRVSTEGCPMRLDTPQHEMLRVLANPPVLDDFRSCHAQPGDKIYLPVHAEQNGNNHLFVSLLLLRVCRSSRLPRSIHSVMGTTFSLRTLRLGLLISRVLISRCSSLCVYVYTIFCRYLMYMHSVSVHSEL